MSKEIDRSGVEALILASPEPITNKKISEVIEGMTPSKVSECVADLNEAYTETGSSFRIRELAGGFQFYIIPEYSGYVRELFTRRRKLRLTRAALETLAIVAYRQPATKTDIEHIRGVASDGVIHNLLEKGMITVKGRSSAVGRPLQYGTTDEFLKFFGLNRLEDMPKMEEIEELVTAADNRDQTQLNLAVADDIDIEAKLNIADGSFDPDSREGDTDEPEAPFQDEQPEAEESVTVASVAVAEAPENPGVIIDLDETSN